MKFAPNLRTAINYCRENGLDYKYERCKDQHYKFYVANCIKWIIICPNKDNRDKVIKDIKNRLDGIRR